MYPLSFEKVRTVGEPIAIVIAESRYIAEDGVDAVVVTYDPLPPITTVEQALMSAVPGLRATIQLLPSDVEAHIDEPAEPR